MMSDADGDEGDEGLCVSAYVFTGECNVLVEYMNKHFITRNVIMVYHYLLMPNKMSLWEFVSGGCLFYMHGSRQCICIHTCLCVHRSLFLCD